MGQPKKKKARSVIMAESYNTEEAYQKKVFPKNDKSKELIRGVLKSSFLFSSLSAQDIEEVSTSNH